MDGLIAALLSNYDYGFRQDEAIEVFTLVKSGDHFFYVEFLTS